MTGRILEHRPELVNKYQSRKKLYTHFPPIMAFPPDYVAFLTHLCFPIAADTARYRVDIDPTLSSSRLAVWEYMFLE